MRKIIIFIILFGGIILMKMNTSTTENEVFSKNIINETCLESSSENKINTDTLEVSAENVIFSIQNIPDYIYKKMLGKSIPLEYKEVIDINKLSYLQISYYGFDEQSHNGEMIVNSKIANDVIEIFKELYEKKYPIEKMKLIDEYNANDELSMSDNNTSCFCYRTISGTQKLSNHSMRNSNRYKSII